MTHYLFVESNTTGTGAIALRLLRRRGDEVTFATRDRTRYPFLDDVRVLEVETNDLDALTARARTLRAIDAVVTFSTFYVSTVAALAARLGLRFLDERAAGTCHDKLAARRTLAAAGLPNPEFREIATRPEAELVAAGMRYPCVMKPPADSGSSGVLQIENAAQFLGHYDTLSSATTNDRGQTGSRTVLVEALLDGPEFSVESITCAPGDTRILGITRKHLSPPPHFVELGHDFPATLGDDERDAIERTVHRALDAVGYDFGPAHIELRLTSRGPVIVEINPRLAGGMIPELVRLATGIDAIDAYLHLLAGAPANLTPTRRRSASIRFLTAPHPGTLETPPRVEDLRQRTGVDAIEIASTPRRATPPRSAYDRLGFVICSGDSPSAVTTQVDEVTAEVAHRLRATIRP